ncbi:MAG: gamma-glutamylcyclotransferase [Proteobacteria bacterium]|jgi:cation transport protein ChaC|nr:gamma-glutamylcyclotransferase [Pseudomonadota bacterium]MDA1301104.1 gamma-glutamylcyclotransferase [Pseudomonadota bacterium]
MNKDIWLFGYGSIVWKADFPHEERHPAYIRGWSRRFWQGSTDHRGVPGRPGRVVTLIEAPDAICWGAAYRIAASQAPSVMAHLDHRERGGYDRVAVDIHLGVNRPGTVTGVTYFATRDNPNYLGEATPEAIATQIRASAGPSGHNVDYLLELEAALLAMKTADDHVSAITRHLKRLNEKPS